jgi:hypothetical protein
MMLANHHPHFRPGQALPFLLGLFLLSGAAAARGEAGTNQTVLASAARPLDDVLPLGKWREVEVSVDRALAWMAAQQAADGSFPTLPQGQPGVTGLCVMAFLSRGHQPGHGPYGRQLERAVDFVLSCQMTNGLFSFMVPETKFQLWKPSHTAVYNHAVSGLMLGEVYGSVNGGRADNVRKAIGRALELTLHMQALPKRFPFDKGGWRYLHRLPPGGADSDLSVTGWQLMFLRSARNAEFQVPETPIDEALEYVRRCWDPRKGVFYYALAGESDVISSRGMMGAGILSLCLGGQHRDPIGLAAGDWLLAHPFGQFDEVIRRTRGGGAPDRFYYSCYYCSQAMAQLGGRYWEQFFPPMVNALLSAWTSDGSWPPESGSNNRIWGNLYSTSLAVLSLTPPYQLLPVYQR